MSVGKEPMAQHNIQANAEYYRLPKYLNEVRAIQYWNQAHEINKCCPDGGRIVEVGPGPGYTTWMLKLWGYDVTTLDFDPALKPDVAGDVTNLPLQNNSFDCVLAAEVLEHLPFADFDRALSELARVSRKYVIITIPAAIAGFSMLLNLPRIKPLPITIGVPCVIRRRICDQHHWEMSTIGYSKRRIRRHIRSQGLKIIREFRPAPALNCYFFVMET